MPMSEKPVEVGDFVDYLRLRCQDGDLTQATAELHRRIFPVRPFPL
jgi:hypothetical protein